MVDLTTGFNQQILDEVDFANPWVEKYRVPVLTNMYPGGFYIATLTVPDKSSETDLWGFLPPSEDDAVLLGRYINFYKTDFYYPHYVKKLEQRSLDIDSGVNTLSFALMEHGWVYRRSTWQNQPFYPFVDSEDKFPTLLSALKHARGYLKQENWLQFLEENE